MSVTSTTGWRSCAALAAQHRDAPVAAPPNEDHGGAGLRRSVDVPVEALLPEMGFDSLMSPELGVVLERQVGVRWRGWCSSILPSGMVDFLAAQLVQMA